MAIWDKADLLSRLRLYTGRPATDNDLTDARAYTFLSDAQREVIEIVANHAPWAMYAAPEKMTTADAGKSYTLNPNTKEWVGRIEVYPTNAPFATPLKEGPLWAPWCDFTMEGESTIRMQGNRARTFGDGPYIRYVLKPGIIDASTEPVLKPDEARNALVYLAAAKWAQVGTYRDPSGYLTEFTRILWGDQNLGREGIIPSLKRQEDQGPGRQAGWWRSADLGR